MNEFLSFVKEWLPVIRDMVVTVAAIIASYVGLKGLSTWRRQLKGKTEYELAKNILRSVYESQEAINSVRDPLRQYSSEPDMPIEKQKELSQREKKWHVMRHAYQESWNPVFKAKSDLNTALFEAEVIWGEKVVDKVTPLFEMINKLYQEINDLLAAMNPNVDYEKQSEEERTKRHEILYVTFPVEQDEYKNRLEEVIATIEEELKPHIEEYHR